MYSYFSTKTGNIVPVLKDVLGRKDLYRVLFTKQLILLLLVSISSSLRYLGENRNSCIIKNNKGGPRCKFFPLRFSFPTFIQLGVKLGVISKITIINYIYFQHIRIKSLFPLSPPRSVLTTSNVVLKSLNLKDSGFFYV